MTYGCLQDVVSQRKDKNIPLWDILIQVLYVMYTSLGNAMDLKFEVYFVELFEQFNARNVFFQNIIAPQSVYKGSFENLADEMINKEAAHANNGTVPRLLPIFL